MSEPEYICKHCGGSRFSAEVAARGYSSGGAAVKNGKPYFDGDRHFTEFDDFDEEGYACDDCGASAVIFEKLVTEKLADGQLLRPCGRCDHSVTDHPLLDVQHPGHFTRGPMPCAVEDCDCHDYYDLAIANAGVTLEIAA